MMVEQSRYVEDAGMLMRNLDQATQKLTEATSKQSFSPKEMKEVMKALQTVNSTLGPSFWADKKLVPEGMKGTIERALAAIALFQGLSYAHAGQTNVQQAIASLFASLSKELKDFDKNLRNLKKHKIGRKVGKVEKASETKKPLRDR